MAIINELNTNGLQKTNSTDMESNNLIFYLGSGTFNLSVFGIDAGIKSTAGDSHLGYMAFDKRMVDDFVQVFRRE